MDAAVAMAAGMQLCEPCSTGLGGDCFVLWYDAKTKTISAMNGSGRSPSALTLERATADLAASSSAAATAAGCLPALHPHTITIPGAAASWCDALDKWGTLPMSTVLAPVIDIAKRGFPVSPITAHNWSEGQRVLKHWRLAAAASAAATTDGGGSNGKPAHLPRDQPESLLVLKAGVEPGSARDMSDYRAPMAGEVFRNPALASTLELLGREGKAGFYSRTSPIARSIIEAVQSVGGVMSYEDLEAHVTTFPEALSVDFCGLRVWECPPNGQGIVALMALNIMKEAVAAQLQRAGPAKEKAEHRVGDPRQSGPAGSTPADASSASSPSTTSSASSYCGFNLSTSLPLLNQDDVAILHHLASFGHNSAQYLHLVIEALRLAFADARQFVADPDVVNVPSAALLTSAYAKKRAALIRLDRATADIAAGQPQTTCDTVSFQVVDKDGNACAFINSNYMGFGSGLVPIGCGFSLQNRGANFSLQPGHPNVLAPSKRPYHTIIPAMVTDRNDNLVACYSNMGGFMQPQVRARVLACVLALLSVDRLVVVGWFLPNRRGTHMHTRPFTHFELILSLSLLLLPGLPSHPIPVTVTVIVTAAATTAAGPPPAAAEHARIQLRPTDSPGPAAYMHRRWQR